MTNERSMLQYGFLQVGSWARGGETVGAGLVGHELQVQDKVHNRVHVGVDGWHLPFVQDAAV